MTRRQVLAWMTAAAIGGAARGAVAGETASEWHGRVTTNYGGGAGTITGKLSGKKINIPDVDAPPMPALAPPGVIHDGRKAENFDEITESHGRESQLKAYRRHLGLEPVASP